MTAYQKSLLKIVLGPAGFGLVFLLCWISLSYGISVVVATFIWAVVWWVLQPIPWTITSLIPLFVFPMMGILSTGETVALFGQNIFFWILGTVMLGYAMEKHGLAKRMALGFLSVKGGASTTYRLTFMFMLATAVVSMFVSDAAAVAIMIPIGMSVVSYLRRLGDGKRGFGNVGAIFALGALCAAEAGGMATIVGLPHNALAVALAESLGGRSIGWFQWMMVGTPLFLTVLVVDYWILRFFFPPEFKEIPGGEQVIRRQLKALGNMNRGEANVLIAFFVMVTLFILPSLVALILGRSDPLAADLKSSLPIWVVPPFTLVLLFLLPIDAGKGEFTLEWKDVSHHAPWNAMFLCASALAMTDALAEFGFTELVAEQLQDFVPDSATLPFFVAFVVGIGTNVISGLAATSLFCNIFIPIAVETGFNPASIAMLIPNNGLGIMFPWAGAAAGTAFATGYLKLKDMFKVGLAATIALALITASGHLLFAPIL